jgi:hypothetical protein
LGSEARSRKFSLLVLCFRKIILAIEIKKPYYTNMTITRTSPITGISRTKEIDVTIEQVLAWEEGELIQNAMPQLSADDREFIKTGITSEEWDQLFGGEDED